MNNLVSNTSLDMATATQGDRKAKGGMSLPCTRSAHRSRAPGIGNILS